MGGSIQQIRAHTNAPRSVRHVRRIPFVLALALTMPLALAPAATAGWWDIPCHENWEDTSPPCARWSRVLLSDAHGSRLGHVYVDFRIVDTQEEWVAHHRELFGHDPSPWLDEVNFTTHWLASLVEYGSMSGGGGAWVQAVTYEPTTAQYVVHFLAAPCMGCNAAPGKSVDVISVERHHGEGRASATPAGPPTVLVAWA